MHKKIQRLRNYLPLGIFGTASCAEMRTERSSDLLERDQSRESFNVRIGHTALLFSSSPTTTPLHWRSINPLRFIFYHLRLTDFEEKIEGL